MTFSATVKSGIELWVGDPNCQAGHDFLLKELKAKGTAFLPVGTVLTTQRKGNLGEFAAAMVGQKNNYKSCKLIAANALNPLSAASRQDLDILWISIGPQPSDDFAVVQEVKTTSDSSLSYANNLITDYAKLYSVDVQFTLQTKLTVAANQMEALGISSEVCCRTAELAGVSPQTSPQIRLTPTLVHERAGADPVTKLVAVKQTIVSANGWHPAAITCWSIALEDIEARLTRLSQGQS